jgi:bacillolysin
VWCWFVWLVGCGVGGAHDDDVIGLSGVDGWSRVVEPRTGYLTMLLSPAREGPARAGLVADAIGLSREFLEARPDIFGSASGSDQLVFLDLRVDPTGGASVRFALQIGGLVVDGGEIVVLLARDGRVRAVTGSFPTPARLQAVPVLDAASAQRLASASGAIADPMPRLVARRIGDRLHAAWRVRVDHGGVIGAREVFVDATTGATLFERALMRPVAARGSGVGSDGVRRQLDCARSGDAYVLRDETRGRGIRTYDAGEDEDLPGALVRSRSPDVWDAAGEHAGAAVDAHLHAARVWDYLGATHDRRGLDGAGGSLAVVVHFGEGFANAFWDGSRAVFGDGDGVTVRRPLSSALDVVAHELVHGLDGHAAGFVYEGESGALDESIADVLATLIEHRRGGGNWQLGEELVDGGLRDLADPARLGDPTHWEERADLPLTPEGDMGGVHVNSTIPSHAAYLLAEGGVHQRSGIRVHPIGRDRLGAIWYRALTLYLGPRASFADFAAATRAAAVDLYGAGSLPAGSTDEAWRAVGL